MDTRFLESLTVADTGSFAEAARRLREYASQVVDLRGPHEFAAGIKEIRDQLAAIAQTLGIKAAQ